MASCGADEDRGTLHGSSYFVIQEILIGMLRHTRIEESRKYRRFRGRVIDGRKNSPRNFALGLFTVCGNGVWANSTRTIHVLLPIPVGGSKAILPLSSGGVLAFFAFAAVPRPGHRFQTSLRDRLLADLTHPVGTLLDPSECLFDCS